MFMLKVKKWKILENKNWRPGFKKYIVRGGNHHEKINLV